MRTKTTQDRVNDYRLILTKHGYRQADAYHLTFTRAACPSISLCQGQSLVITWAASDILGLIDSGTRPATLDKFLTKEVK